jgi:WD40 repeat protein
MLSFSLTTYSWVDCLMRHARFLTLLALPLLLHCPTPVPVASQADDIFIIDIMSSGGFVAFGDPLNLTERQQYDNQPAFSPDGQGLFYSRREGNQTDIFHIDLAHERSIRLTSTLESEYSPLAMPGESGFSVVRLELDGRQRLWRFNRDGQHPELLADLDGYLGYYTWVSDERLLAVILGEPWRLELHDLTDGSSRQLASGIGRSIQVVPGGQAVSYVHKLSPDEWWVEEVDLTSGERNRLIRTPVGSEDHVWTSSGSLLMGSDSIIYSWDREDAAEWTELLDLTDKGIGDITRLAISPDGGRLALVGRQSTD